MQVDGEALTAIGLIVGSLAGAVALLYRRAGDRETTHAAQLLQQEKEHDAQMTAKDAELATERRERRMFVETQLSETRAAREADRELYERVEALVAGQVKSRGPLGSGSGGARR